MIRPLLLLTGTLLPATGNAALEADAAVGALPASWSLRAAQDTTSRDTVSLAPLVVSVLRSPARLDRLPFSASVLAGSDLSDGTAGVFIEESLHGLPGVRVQNRYNPAGGRAYLHSRLRGTRPVRGPRDQGAGGRRSCDPSRRPNYAGSPGRGLLGRVEALRGPAAALYGNGAGGVLLFTSAEPFAGPARWQAVSVAGSDGLLRLQATVSGTAGKLKYRASGARSRFDGFRNNVSDSGEDPYSGATRTTVNAGFDREAGGGVLSARVIGLDLSALNPGSLPSSLFDEGSNQAWGFNVARRTRKDVRQGQVGVAWRGPVGSLQGDVSAYGVRRTLDNPIPTRVVDLTRNGGGVRLALAKEWDRGPGAARLDFGAEGELQSDDRQNFANQGGERGAVVLNQQERVRAAAVFGQLRLPATRRLDVVGALRFDRFGFSADDRFVGPDNPDDSGDRTMSAVSPSLGFHLALGDHGLFASVARSFETPTTTELANQPDRAGGLNPSLDPQRGWTAEGGLRGEMGRAAYDLAVFSSRISNQLVPFEVPSAPGRRFYRNAGKSTVRGFEASARVALSQHLTARVAYGYTDARFDDFEVDGDRFDDNRVPGVAPHLVEGAVRAGGGRWFGELRVEVRGSVPVNDANDASADRYALLDLRFGASGLRAGGLRLSPFAGVTNAANARYASSVVVNAFGSRYFEPGPDRGGYVGLSLAWDRGDG